MREAVTNTSLCTDTLYECIPRTSYVVWGMGIIERSCGSFRRAWYYVCTYTHSNTRGSGCGIFKRGDEVRERREAQSPPGAMDWKMLGYSSAFIAAGSPEDDIRHQLKRAQ